MRVINLNTYGDVQIFSEIHPSLLYSNSPNSSTILNIEHHMSPILKSLLYQAILLLINREYYLTMFQPHNLL